MVQYNEIKIHNILYNLKNFRLKIEENIRIIHYYRLCNDILCDYNEVSL